MESVDKFNLTRFLTAQERHYPRALFEIRHGRKRTHWIWFIYPSPVGISTSSTGTKFGISSLSEAYAYLQHPILQARLIEITQAVLDSDLGTSMLALMGGSAVDVEKMQASMTMFVRADPEKRVFDFKRVLDRFYGGLMHEKTDRILGTEKMVTDGEDGA